MSKSLRPTIKFAPGFTALYQEYCSSERGERLLKLWGISREQLDVATMTQKYFEFRTPDMSVDANANVGNTKNPNNFSCEVVKGHSKLTAYHLLWSRIAEDQGEEEASELIGRIWRGYLYFHDLTGHGVTAPYCFAATTLPLIFEGRPYGQLYSSPPKRASSFIAQAIEFTMDLSQEFMGAIALSDVIVNHAMMCLKDGVDPDTPEGRKKVENNYQQFVHVVNNSFRTAAQSPFSNIPLFDRPQLKALFKEYEYPDGSKVVDNVEYVMKMQRIFMAFIAAKDPISGMPYRFPIATVNITTNEGKVLDEEFLKSVCEFNTEGVFNIYITDGVGKLAMCCRFVNDPEVRSSRQRSDVFGNGGLNIGSTRVCTVNLARLAFESSGPIEFKALLRGVVRDAVDLLVAHREILGELIDGGYLKFFKPLGWISLDMFFSTIGVVGLSEAMALFGEDYELPKKKGVKKAEEILKYIDGLAVKFSKEKGVPLNVEQIPAEGAAVTLAKADKVFHPKSPYAIYSNQSIPLWVDVDLVTRAKVDGKLNQCYSGGGISHLNIGSAVTPEQMHKLILFAIEQGLDHFALNPVFSRCENGHVSLGSSDECPKCGGLIVDHLTRVVGYFVPVSDWAKVRREFEFPKRVWGEVPEDVLKEESCQV